MRTSRCSTGPSDGIGWLRHLGVSVHVRSLVLANQKGGVGKTTTAVHLAHGLALAGRKVALFDLDPQGNATVAIQGMEGGSEGDGGLELLAPVAENLWLLPSPGADHLVEPETSVDLAKLKELVRDLETKLDWLIVDCPPRLDAWGMAGLHLGDEVLVPVQAEFFAIHGLSQMLQALEAIAGQVPGKAHLRGVLATMVDAQEPITLEVVEDLRRNLGSLVCQTLVLRDSHLVEAASHGRTGFLHCPWARGTLCYSELVKELLDG